VFARGSTLSRDRHWRFGQQGSGAFECYSQTQMRRLLLIAAATTLLAQRPWREFPAFEYNDFPIPPDYQEKTEFVFGRLMYPNANVGRGFRRFGGRDWRQGGTHWTMDYPRSDRHLMLALRRLSRIHARSVEQPINLEEHDQFDWPWLYGVEVGHWDLSGDLAKELREIGRASCRERV